MQARVDDGRDQEEQSRQEQVGDDRAPAGVVAQLVGEVVAGLPVRGLLVVDAGLVDLVLELLLLRRRIVERVDRLVVRR